MARVVFPRPDGPETAVTVPLSNFIVISVNTDLFS